MLMACVFDRKTGAGMLIGFFLAATMLFGYVQLAMAPDYQNLLQTKKYAQLSYDITHSAAYASIQTFVDKLDQGAHDLVNVPIIGGMVDKSEVGTYTQTVISLLEGRKELAAQELNLINAEISLIQLSLPALIVSIVMVGAGIYVLMEEKGTKPKAAKAKKGRKR